MRLSCTSSGSTPRNSTCPDEKDWTSITALQSRKSWFSTRYQKFGNVFRALGHRHSCLCGLTTLKPESHTGMNACATNHTSPYLRTGAITLLAILTACAGLVRAAQPWTVDAILNIPTLADPQIRPDGAEFAYVRQSLDGKVWRNAIFVAPIPSGAAQEIGVGSHPRWSPDSRRLAWLHGQVYVGNSAVTHSPTSLLTYSWTPDSAGIVYLAADPGPAPDPIVADGDYRYTRLYLQPLSGGEARRLTTADRHVVSFALSPDGTRAVYAAQPTPRNRDSFDCDLYEIDLRTLAERPIVVQPGRDADPS